MIPTELSFSPDVNKAQNIVIQNNIMIISETGFNIGEIKVYNIPTIVDSGATVGKTVVTTGYVSYYLPVVGSKLVKDEASAYMIANIAEPILDTSKDINKDNSDKEENTVVANIFPQTLLSWLILFAVILIIVVLIMNIHNYLLMRRKEKKEHIISHHIS